MTGKNEFGAYVFSAYSVIPSHRFREDRLREKSREHPLY